MHSDYLLEKLGPVIQAALQDDHITEIMLNPDGRLWLVHQNDGTVETGFYLQEDAKIFVRVLP
ncbi:MAG: hypothetical protein A3F10_06950 [Coxiella sp. RIFCSPHIGHO2_12_FULL_42_15]|nr:MAG: hypothetical protein A3F10_06950 [Coxiella sp. RIFCSPHIGHO2_12_FULL_42_15]